MGFPRPRMTDRQTGKGGRGLTLNNLLDRPQDSIRIMWVRLYTSDLLGKAILRNPKIVVRLQFDPIRIARAEVGR